MKLGSTEGQRTSLQWGKNKTNENEGVENNIVSTVAFLEGKNIGKKSLVDMRTVSSTWQRRKEINLFITII